MTLNKSIIQLIYLGSMKGLAGEWLLSLADKQEGKATKHQLVAPLVGSDAVGMSFKLVGKGSNVQKNLLPDTKKEMVSCTIAKMLLAHRLRLHIIV